MPLDSVWYPGETHVHRPLDDVALLLRSEDLRVAPVLTQWNQRSLWDDRRLPEDLVVAVEGERFYHAHREAREYFEEIVKEAR